MAQEDPAECEGVAGGGIVETRKHYEVPPVVACRVRGFMYSKNGVERQRRVDAGSVKIGAVEVVAHVVNAMGAAESALGCGLTAT